MNFILFQLQLNILVSALPLLWTGVEESALMLGEKQSGSLIASTTKVSQGNKAGFSTAAIEALSHNVAAEERLAQNIATKEMLVGNIATEAEKVATMDKAAVKSAFITEQELLGSKQIIKPASSTTNRFMTYNVENLKNKDAVVETIIKADPHTVVLQEVPEKDLKAISAQLKDKGYTSSSNCMNYRIGKGVLGNVIFSKHTIKSSHSYNLADPYGKRCLAEALIATPTGDIVAFGTHLSNKGSWYRSWQMDKISSLANERAAQGLPHQMLMADMNAKPDEIAKSAIPSMFTDSFHASGQEVPKASQWRGNWIDHVYISPSLVETSGQRPSSVVVHSGASDHVPIIADVGMAKAGTGNAPSELSRSRVFDMMRKEDLAAVGIGIVGAAGVGFSAAAIANQ